MFDFIYHIELRTGGIERTTPMRAIGLDCIDCCAGTSAELQRCVVVRYALWHFMTGANSFQRRR
jgi:hypothetical protein